MKTQYRVALERASVARTRATDGPFAETKELIGSCLFAPARRRDEAPPAAARDDAAAAAAARDLCVVCGRRINMRLHDDSARLRQPHGL